MAKNLIYVCKNCGYETIGKFGKCPECGAWGSFTEKELELKKSQKTPLIRKIGQNSVQKLNNVTGKNSDRVVSNIKEFDRVMGGGIVQDSVTIISARPGAGKSTLLMQISNMLANLGMKVLYASGEESETQLKKRAERLFDKTSDNIFVISTNSLDNVVDNLDKNDIDVLIVDSIQTFVLEEFLPSRAGSPTQSLECAYKCVEIAKNNERPRIVFLVGQLNKEDEISGLRAIEHLVDTVLYIEGEKGEAIRNLVATKNRYGSTGEIGFFIMEENGLISIDNPSEYFMTVRDKPVKGSALASIKEGSRSILMEVESLMSQSFTPYPSRITDYIKKDSLNICISILEDKTGLKFFDKNVVLKAVGGFRIYDPSINFAIIMSIASSYYNKPIKNDVVFIGDVALTGEVRKAQSINDKIMEADRLGVKEIAIGNKNPDVKANNANIVRFKDIMEAINYYLK
ncbi:MAG: DNA repair protein RadA [Ezakiella sp.]|nr:DNA repair protein RadA [Ezakiella sp.]MDD7471819.1 AAA family ATPase [Bacillota bacterium]MDY3923783.1 AAA family ATPase [Ezakiella sp.]